jgi:hypothetical protein
VDESDGRGLAGRGGGGQPGTTKCRRSAAGRGRGREGERKRRRRRRRE